MWGKKEVFEGSGLFGDTKKNVMIKGFGDILRKETLDSSVLEKDFFFAGGGNKEETLIDFAKMSTAKQYPILKFFFFEVFLKEQTIKCLEGLKRC